MEAPHWIPIIGALLITAQLTHVQAQDTTEQISEDTTTSSSDSGSDGINNKAKIIIIVLSAVAGVATICLAFSIIYIIAQRRQWDVRGDLRQSTSRMVDVVKSPLIPCCSKPVGSETSHRSMSLSSFSSRRRGRNRSTRRMSRIMEGSPVRENIFNPDELEFITAPGKVFRPDPTTESRWLQSESMHHNPESFHFDLNFRSVLGGRSDHKRRKSNRIQKRRNFDLERDIELGSNNHMKVSVSTLDNNLSPNSYNSHGVSAFAFGRH